MKNRTIWIIALCVLLLLGIVALATANRATPGTDLLEGRPTVSNAEQTAAEHESAKPEAEVPIDTDPAKATESPTGEAPVESKPAQPEASSGEAPVESAPAQQDQDQTAPQNTNHPNEETSSESVDPSQTTEEETEDGGVIIIPDGMGIGEL